MLYQSAKVVEVELVQAQPGVYGAIDNVKFLSPTGRDNKTHAVQVPHDTIKKDDVIMVRPLTSGTRQFYRFLGRFS